MANGTIAFDTLQTSGQITGTAKSVDTDYVVNGSAKVWAHLDLNTENTIDDSLNVASITDRATGRFTVTYTNAMATVNYTSLGSAFTGTSTNYSSTATPDEARTTTTVFMATSLSNFTLADYQDVDIVNHGDLA
jgi:hypothetical protein